MHSTRAALWIALAGLGIAPGCKVRQADDQGSGVRAAGAKTQKAPNDFSGVEKLDAMDISFLLPQVRPGAPLQVKVSEHGQTEAGEDLGPLLEFSYFDELGAANGVPEFMEARDLFRTGSGAENGKTRQDVYDSLFISAFRFDPCASTEYRAQPKADALFPPTPDAACEPEIRLVAQHWFPNVDPTTKQPLKDKNGDDDVKVGDNGFHLVYGIAPQERFVVLQELLALKELYKKLSAGKDTNGEPVGPHPGFEIADAAKAQEFAAAFHQLMMRHIGFKRLKGLASMVTRSLTNPNRTRWQWTLTFNQNGHPVPMAAPFTAGNKLEGGLFAGPAGSIGFEVTPGPTGQTGQIVPKSTSLPYGDKNDKARLKAGTTGSPVAGLSPPSLIETLLSPSQVIGKRMNDQVDLTRFEDTAFNDPTAKPTTTKGPLLLALEAAYASENPRLRVVQPQPHLGPDGLLAGVNDCSSCHVETPGRLRAAAAMQGFDESKIRTRFPGVPGVTGTMREDVRQEYLAGASTNESYVVLNMAWHTKFSPAGTPSQIFPAINQRTINETVDVVRFIREELPQRFAQGTQPGGGADDKDPTGGNVESDKPAVLKFDVNVKCARSGGRKGDISEMDLQFDVKNRVGLFTIKKVGSSQTETLQVADPDVVQNDRNGIEVEFFDAAPAKGDGFFKAEAVDVVKPQRSRIFQVSGLKFLRHPDKEKIDSNLFCVRARKP
jgi:hypothetical protein